MRDKRRPVLVVLVGAWVVGPLLRPAFGGPPLITDDPETPGKGGWEINFSYNLELIRETVFESLPGGGSSKRLELAREHMVPLVDINYGRLENDQWKIEFPVLNVREPDGTYERGVGDVEVGWKFRFLDEEDSPFSMSIYPQLVIPTGDERRGLGGGRLETIFPVQIGRHFLNDRLFLYAEVGYTAFESREQDDAWSYGVAAEYEVFDGFELVGEIHGEVPVTGPSRPDVLFNLGFKYALTENISLITAMGRSFSAKDGNGPEFIGFWGVQFTF